MTAPRYALAGNRPGWNLAGLKRTDCPPNRNGTHYSEFRRPDGTLQALILTDLVEGSA